MSGNGSKLITVTRALSVQWEQTKESWKDDKSLEFERQYIQELLAGVDRAIGVMEQFDKLITKIRKDCE
jgi:hypothetical protein